MFNNGAKYVTIYCINGSLASVSVLGFIHVEPLQTLFIQPNSDANIDFPSVQGNGLQGTGLQFLFYKMVQQLLSRVLILVKSVSSDRARCVASNEANKTLRFNYNTPLPSLKNSNKLFYTPLNVPLGYLQQLFQDSCLIINGNCSILRRSIQL